MTLILTSLLATLALSSSINALHLHSSHKSAPASVKNNCNRSIHGDKASTAIESTTARTAATPVEKTAMEEDDDKTLQLQRFSAEKGYYLAKTPWRNKGSSFSHEERERHSLRGLYPAGEPLSLDVKLDNLMTQLRSKSSPLEKYIFLHTIQDSDETLFYSALTKHTAEVMPFVYTPTVGEACQKWGTIFRQTPRGLYISLNDKGKIRSMLDNVPNKDIQAIVFTDGERILGLGDLGVNGMGIPIGKLALYTACAGIHPSRCLPVHIDVGTERKELLSDPTYMGLRRTRERGVAYDELIEEFIEATKDAYGRNVLLQFEDFGNSNAFRLLDRYKTKANCFNDDIQGTASVVLAGIISSLKLSGRKSLEDHRYLFYGAGEAGVGIADLLASAISRTSGLSMEAARKKIWLVDSQGLVSDTRSMDTLAHHKQPYAHALTSLSRDDTAALAPVTADLLSSVRIVRPTVLIGVSAQGQAFTQAVCEEMVKISRMDGGEGSGLKPLIFALSNPTSKAECTAQQAYEWTNGECVFASGSPFDPVTITVKGKEVKFVPGQGNNAYIFPGVGLGAIISGATSITDDDFYIAAACLAEQVTEERLATGCAYPSLADIRAVSARISAAVARNIHLSGRSTALTQSVNSADSPGLDYYLKLSEKAMYVPSYDISE